MTRRNSTKFPLARWSQKVTHEDDLVNFSQSLDNASFSALLKGMQVITGSRSQKIFGYVLNRLPARKFIFAFSKVKFNLSQACLVRWER